MWLPIVFALFVVAVDQGTKLWALSTLTIAKPVPVVGEALQWMLVKNSGAAFSLASNATWVFTLISATVAVLIILNLHRLRSTVWSLVAGLVLGGTLGNLIDRLFREPGFGRGHVIDFIYTPWMMPAIYNVADIAVVTGMGIFVLLTLLGIDREGKRRRTVSEVADSQEQQQLSADSTTQVNSAHNDHPESQSYGNKILPEE